MYNLTWYAMFYYVWCCIHAMTHYISGFHMIYHALYLRYDMLLAFMLWSCINMPCYLFHNMSYVHTNPYFTFLPFYIFFTIIISIFAMFILYFTMIYNMLYYIHAFLFIVSHCHVYMFICLAYHLMPCSCILYTVITCLCEYIVFSFAYIIWLSVIHIPNE